MHAISKAKSVSHSLQKKQQQAAAAANGLVGKKKMNPILAMLRSNNHQGRSQQRRSGQQQESGRSSSSSPAGRNNSVMSKSVSVMEDMSAKAAPENNAVYEKLAAAGQQGDATGIVSQAKRSASESNLLNKCEADPEKTTPAPAGANEDGFYKSFDELADDIDDLASGVLANSNPLEASVVLRPQQQMAASSSVASSDAAARCSFNSSDSGRMSSDTYGETSNSSVASASNSTSSHSNRLYSNCSEGDSGLSAGSGSAASDCSSGTGSNSNGIKMTMGTLPENESGAAIYGHCRPVKNGGENGDATYSQIEDDEAR